MCTDCAMKQRLNGKDEAIDSGKGYDREHQRNEEYHNRHGPELDKESKTVTSEEDE
jgi:hypothetical protein